MKKLYYATRYSDVMFVSDERHDLLLKAEHFLEEQNECFHTPPKVVEISSISDIPKEWRGDILIFGTDKDITAKDFLLKNDPEYLEYLRLKKNMRTNNLKLYHKICHI